MVVIGLLFIIIIILSEMLKKNHRYVLEVSTSDVSCENRFVKTGFADPLSLVVRVCVFPPQVIWGGIAI